MKVHLVRSNELPVRRFLIILKMLKEFIGPVEFIAKEESMVILQELNYVYSDLDYNIMLDKKLSWSELFDKCEMHRKSQNIPPNEAVILLTDHANEMNWFSAWEPSGKLNFFVQTSGWEYYIDAESCYPIMYEIASIALALSFCKNLKEVEEMAHSQPKGCMFDFCQHKEDVKWRIRTGDICPDCLNEITKKNIDSNIVCQVLEIIEWIRKQVMFKERFNFTKRPSKMEIDLHNVDLIFTEIGNIKVHLVPQEMIIYRLFLKYVDGLYLDDVKKFKAELKRFYERHSHEVIIANIENSIQELLDRKNSLNETISRIKKKLTEAVGSEMAEHYIIKKGNGKYKILFDRKYLVNYPDKIV